MVEFVSFYHLSFGEEEEEVEALLPPTVAEDLELSPLGDSVSLGALTLETEEFLSSRKLL